MLQSALRKTLSIFFKRPRTNISDVKVTGNNEISKKKKIVFSMICTNHPLTKAMPLIGPDPRFL